MMQVNGVFIHSQFGDNIGGIGAKISVTKHYPFCRTGCPAGIQEAGEIVAMAASILGRAVAADETFISMKSLRRCLPFAVNQLPPYPVRVLQKHFLEFHEFRTEDYYLWRAIVGLGNDLVQAEPVIQRNNNSSSLHYGIETF
jgi:hypothetical protein